MRAHLASLVEDFRRRARETAVVAHRGNRRYPTTYGELAVLAGRFAAELDRRGIPPGERVVLWSENSAEWIGVFFGCILRGVIAVPLDAAGSAEFANKVVQDVAPKLIVGDSVLLTALASSLPQMVLTRLYEQMPHEPAYGVSAAVQADAPFQIIFTSGTTAEPKGIVLTHRNVLASLQPIEQEITKYLKYERWVHPLRFLHSVPLSHVFGQFMAMWIPPLLAAEVHFGERLEPSRMTQLIRRERISVLVAVPRILQLMQTHLLAHFGSLAREIDEAKDLRIWERWWHFRKVHRVLGLKFWAVISGGAALPSDLEDFWNRLGFALIQGYGMTETTALVTLNHPFHIGRGTIGKPLPGREVRISDDGEILVRGDVLAAGTWQGGAIHRQTGEWLATGDLAAREDSGEIRFLGRKGDVIVTGAGMNVHAADLETALMKQPGIRGCCVVPCEGPTGPEPVAVVLFAGSEDELHARVESANRGLAEYQQMRRVFRWPELQFPYTTTGKLRRRVVAEWVCATVARQRHGVGTVADAGGDVLLAMIASVTGEMPPGDNDQLRISEDLHLDSLGRVQLQSALEHDLGLEVADDALASMETLGQLRALLQQVAGATATLPSLAQAGQSRGMLQGDKAADAVNVEAVAGTPAQGEAGAVAREHAYPFWPWSWPVRALRVLFLELVVRPLVWLLGAPRVVFESQEMPTGPVLVIANHVSAYDGPLVLYALPFRLRRRMAIAMSGEMLLDLRRGRNQKRMLLNLLGPAAYWLVTALFNVFPLPRSRGFQRSFEHAGVAMDRGFSVLVFPEGMRSPDGRLLPFRAGIGLLTAQSQVPVIPVALNGTAEMQSGETSWFRSGKLEIRIGAPVKIEDGEEPSHLARRLEDLVRQLQSRSFR